jgi:ATP-dependent Clp protease ATP-binding subunit ClpB
VRRRPYSVVLLDEIEKAHPDVFNILLQVLDDGRLTDNKGRVANFKNSIIIMTSNIGSTIIQESFENMNEGNRDEILSGTKSKVYELLKKTIRPEFLNRIDEVIMFQPLTRDEVKDIVKIQFTHLQKMLAQNDITITATEDAIDWLSQLGFDPQFGARPLKRVMQKKVLNELSKQILGGEVNKDDHILLDINNRHEFVFRNERIAALQS